MNHTLVPDDLLDRQVAVSRDGVDGLVTIIDGQRSVLAAALQLPLLTFEAIAHLTRSLASTIVDVTDRAVTSSTESLEQLRESLALTDGHEAQRGATTPSRRPASAPAA